MIQDFLNLQFIPLTEDTNFDKLKKAAAEVVKKTGKDKAKIASYASVALDPNVSADNSIIIETKKVIIDYWNTFLANSNDSAITVIRAVILEALKTIAKDIDHAAVIWFSCRNIIKYYHLGREKEILINFLQEIGNRIENEVSETWAVAAGEEIELPRISVAAIDKTEIETTLKAAAIYQPWGEGGENQNPPAEASLNWAKFFSTKAAKGLTEIINKALKKQVAEILKNQNDFAIYNSLFQMRTQLLWWKQAAYSTTNKCSYKEIEPGILPFVLAKDYSSFVPKKYPVSVDYYLKETSKDFKNVGDVKTTIRELANNIMNSKDKLQSLFEDFENKENRISLFNFIRGLIHGRYTVNQCAELVGVPESTEIFTSELTCWIFHDIHLIKLSR